ncbi:MAG: hypothetical protein ACR2FY_15085 [Pirellulaceae bacterium]
MTEQNKASRLWKIAVWAGSVLIGGGLLAVAIQRGCDYSDKVTEANLPVVPLRPRDTDSGAIAFPYKNPATRNRLVQSATLEILDKPPVGPGGAGATAPRHTIRFEPRHFNQVTGRYERRIDDLVLDAGETGYIEVELVASGKKTYRYVRLTLWYDDNGDKPLTFEPQWIPTVPLTAMEEKAEPATGPDAAPKQDDDTAPGRFRRGGRRR